MNILGIETSCDETACAVVKDGREVLTNVVYTQIPLHQPYGGVVPEVASRAHIEKIHGVVQEAMKGGVPVDADIVIDMRFVENPFYYEDMRYLSGLDEKVRTFVLGQPYVKEYLDHIEQSVIDTLPLYEKQDKHILRICFGCTGGRHRSVAAAEELAARLRRRGHAVRIYHREARLELQDIETRTEKREP